MRPGTLIRAATAADNAQIAAIWNDAVQRSTATFTTELRTPAQQEAWLAAHSDAYPALVIVVAQEVLAYGALSPYWAQPAYSTTVEDAVYVKVGQRGQGLGHVLLGALLERARACAYHTVMARITGGNAASLRLHERHGFHLVGVEREVGVKFGRWQDVVLMQRMLTTAESPARHAQQP
jgi:L-amino acid N-acyltransferase YncA